MKYSVFYSTRTIRFVFVGLQVKLSGTSKFPHSSKIQPLLLSNKCRLPALMEWLIVRDKSGQRIDGLGIFHIFPRNGKQQIGWIPKDILEDVRAIIDAYSDIQVQIDSCCVDDLTPTFSKVSIIVSISAK